MPIIACNKVPLRSWAKMYTRGKGKRLSRIANLLSAGNLKVPSSIAIFNMSPASSCPSMKLGLCRAFYKGKHICYALKAEKGCWPNVLPQRRKQEKYWMTTSAMDFASNFVLVNALKVKPFTALRFNEAGDFHSQACVTKAEEIAMLLHRFGIRTYCYTSRSDLDFTKCRHLVVSGSSFKKKGISNVFKIIENKKMLPKGFGICKMDCRICKRCLSRNLNTAVVKH